MKPLICAVAVAAFGHVVFAQEPPGTRAFIGARVINGTGAAALENATILVRDGRIVAIGAANDVAVPQSSERVVLTGKTVIPGLINAHGHVSNVNRDLSVYAAYGVTTVFSLGNDNDPQRFLTARDAQRTPDLRRTRLFTAGPVLDPKSVAEASALVAKSAALGVDIIKIRIDTMPGPKMPPDIYRAVIDEAHRRGLRVAVHIVLLADAKGVLDAGADFIAHSVRDADVDAELIAKMKARTVCLSPTLMRDVATFIYESTPSFFADPLFLSGADPKVVETLRDPARQERVRTSPQAEQGKAMVAVARRNVKALADAGVTIAMGTDTGPQGRFQGYFELMELEEMVRAGLSPQQSLAAATRDAARCMGIDRELGTIEQGKWADFVVLEADPLVDIANVRRIDSVWIAGNRVER